MRGISRYPTEPAWAPPGRWTWTVTLSLIGTVLISASMLFPSLVFGHGQRSTCVTDGDRVYRMMGPGAWHAVEHCTEPPAAGAF